MVLIHRGLGCNPRLAARSGGLAVCRLAAAQVAGCPSISLLA